MIMLLAASCMIWTLCAGPLYESLYYKLAKPGMFMFIISSVALFLALYLYIAFVFPQRSRHELKMAIHLAEFTLFIDFANLVSLPMNVFRSGMTIRSVNDTAKDALVNNILLIGTAAAAIIFFSIISDKQPSANKKPKHKIKSTVWAKIIFFANFISASLLIIARFTTDRGIDTTTIFHKQVGAIIMAMLVAETDIIYNIFFDPRRQIHGNKTKYAWAVAGSIVLLLGSFALRSEMGLPLFYVGALLCWYYFCIPEKKVRFRNKLLMQEKFPYIYLSFIISLLLILLVAGLFIFYFAIYQRGLVGADDLGGLGSKLDRFKCDSIQVNQAVDRIASAGLLYQLDYAQVIEGMSDCSFAHCTHYIGIIWSLLTISFLTMTALSGFCHIHVTKKSGRPLSPLFCVSLCFILLMSINNILANLGITPLIGVSCFASGYGNTHYILCGLLLGAVLYPHTPTVSNNTIEGGSN